jgi:ubiquinone/menaquinone biosynthesis C-methylase UbiE
MIGFGHHAGSGSQSRKRFVIAFILLAKLALVAGALVLLQFEAGYIGAGIGVAVLHGFVIAVIAVLAVWGSTRHKDLVSGTAHRSGDKPMGIVLHKAVGYDMLARVLTLGREGRFREFMLRLAELKAGESVLDVACGTGTLAIAAKRKVATDGSVIGVDASVEMIERARIKAERVGLDLTFVEAAAQELPFGDDRFDVVTGTLMLHHLPKPARSSFAREARRVLKPGGRLLLIDFGKPLRKSLLPRLHRHGHVDMHAVGAILEENGFEISDTGPVGTKNLNYIRAVKARVL